MAERNIAADILAFLEAKRDPRQAGEMISLNTAYRLMYLEVASFIRSENDEAQAFPGYAGFSKRLERRTS